MKRTTKHVALDVHQATTVASVREESGRVIARTILPTEDGPIVEFFRGMRGTIHVAFEEGTQPSGYTICWSRWCIGWWCATDAGRRGAGIRAIRWMPMPSPSC